MFGATLPFTTDQGTRFRPQRLAVDWVTWTQFERGTLGVNQRTARARIGFREQFLDGNMHEIRITVVGFPDRKGEFCRLGDQMYVVYRVVPHAL